MSVVSTTETAAADRPAARLFLDRPSLARFERALGPAHNDEDLHA